MGIHPLFLTKRVFDLQTDILKHGVHNLVSVLPLSRVVPTKKASAPAPSYRAESIIALILSGLYVRPNEIPVVDSVGDIATDSDKVLLATLLSEQVLGEPKIVDGIGKE